MHPMHALSSHPSKKMSAEPVLPASFASLWRHSFQSQLRQKYFLSIQSFEASPSLFCDVTAQAWNIYLEVAYSFLLTSSNYRSQSESDL